MEDCDKNEIPMSNKITAELTLLTGAFVLLAIASHRSLTVALWKKDKVYL